MTIGKWYRVVDFHPFFPNVTGFLSSILPDNRAVLNISGDLQGNHATQIIVHSLYVHEIFDNLENEKLTNDIIKSAEFFKFKFDTHAKTMGLGESTLDFEIGQYGFVVKTINSRAFIMQRWTYKGNDVWKRV